MVTQSFHRKRSNVVSKKLIAAALIAASMSSTMSFAGGFDSSLFGVKGFGTVGVAHSSEDHADFVATPYQPKGVGRTHDWDMAVDSKLGVQVNANLSDKFSAAVQVVSQYQHDNTWRPTVEWANVKYQLTPDFSVRLGRIVLPTLLIYESRKVGYSYAWLRPPEEVYFQSLTTNGDGGDISYRKQFDGVVNTVQAFYGTAVGKFPGGTLKAKPDWGISDTAEVDAWTLRAGYVAYKVDFEASDFDSFVGFANRFAADTAPYFPETSAQVSALLDKYPLKGMNIRIYNLAANYDPGNWFAVSEYVKVKGDSFIPDSNSFYVTAGYRIAQFTPYATLAQVKTDRIKEDDISTAGLPVQLGDIVTRFNAVMNALFAVETASQRTASIGLRWDFMPSADLKIQYDQKSLLDNTRGRLLLAPGTSYQGGDHFSVISAAVDFVF